MYVLIVDGVIKSGGKCKDVMKKSKILKGKEGIAFCRAILSGQPEECPWEKNTPFGAYCSAGASRGSLKPCNAVGKEWDDHDIECCMRFAWRFSSIFSGRAESIQTSEAGALQGDATGCMNALRWGLLESLAGIFDVKLPAETLQEQNLTGEFMCPALIYWSNRPMLLPEEKDGAPAG